MAVLIDLVLVVPRQGVVRDVGVEVRMLVVVKPLPCSGQRVALEGIENCPSAAAVGATTCQIRGQVEHHYVGRAVAAAAVGRRRRRVRSGGTCVCI